MTNSNRHGDWPIEAKVGAHINNNFDIIMLARFTLVTLVVMVPGMSWKMLSLHLVESRTSGLLRNLQASTTQGYLV